MESRKETPVYDAAMRYVIGVVVAAGLAWLFTREPVIEEPCNCGRCLSR